jgi:uncharacterized protein (TIGR04255 family)
MRAPVKFDRPPVVEVACGVLFATQDTLKTAHIGKYWERVKAEFPHVEDALPLPTIVEQQVDAVAEFEWSTLPPLRRTWLTSDDGAHLIQIQGDRFLLNWKRTLNQTGYPSYTDVIKRFDRHLADFISFLKELRIEPPAYRQFELMYVNHITVENGLKEVGMENMLVDHVRATSRERFLPEPDGFNWATSYRLPHNTGRLHIAAQSAVKTSNRERIVRLDLTARGISTDPSEAGRRPWFDTAHEWITHGFADVTSNVLHTTWGRTS